jgi:hypothetical protein
VDIPDEIFFHTIILNSSFASNVVNDDLRCIDISEGRGPRIWRKSDLEILAQSKGLFARKFDTSVDREILDLIELKLLSTCSDCGTSAVQTNWVTSADVTASAIRHQTDVTALRPG